MVQWLRLRASTAGAMGSITGQGPKILRDTWPGQTLKKKPSIHRHTFRNTFDSLIYMHVDTYIFIYSQIHTYSPVFLYSTHIQRCTHVPSHTHTHTFTDLYTVACNHLHPPTTTLSHIHHYICTYAHSHTHTCYVLDHRTNSKVLMLLSLVRNTPELFPITSQEARHVWWVCQLHSPPFFSQEDAPLPESHGRSPGHPGWGAALIGFPRPLTRFRWMAFDQNVPFANILLLPAWAPTSPPPKGKPGTPTPLSTHLGTPKPRQETTFLHSIITSCLNHKLSYNAFAHQMSWQGTPCPCHKLTP